MTVRQSIENQPFGKTMIAILEEQGLMEMLDGDVSGYFRKYRGTSHEIFVDFLKDMFINDPRVAAIMSEDKFKEQAIALTVSDICYLVRSNTGMCYQTINKRIENAPGILRLQGRHKYYKLARPNFTDEELELMKQKIAEAKININIMCIDDYDADDIQVVMNEERCDSQLSD